MTIAQSIQDSLSRTRNAVFGRVATLVGASEVTGDTWDELIKVIKKTNKAYTDAVKEKNPAKKVTWITKIFREYF